MPKVSQEYRDARRTQILDAARRCFARNGFHATSMQDLLAEADLSSGALYRYFASKDDIIVAIGLENLAGVVAAVREIARVHAADGQGAVLAAMLGFVRDQHHRDHLGAMALLVWAESLRNDTLADALRASFVEIRQALVEHLFDGPDDAVTDHDGADRAALMVSVLAGYLLELVVLSPEITDPLPRFVRSLDRHRESADPTAAPRG